MRALLLAVALLALLAPVATAASRNEIIRDCSDDGRLDGNYSANELRDARKNLPADIDQYTDCRDVLRRAELPDGGSGTGTTAGGGTTGGGTTAGAAPAMPLGPSSDAERAALDTARGTSEAVSVGGRTIAPGAAGFAANAARHDLPWPIIGVLALLLAGAIALAVPHIRKRVVSRRAQTA